MLYRLQPDSRPSAAMQTSAIVASQRLRKAVVKGERVRTARTRGEPVEPTENWYEPVEEDADGYRIVVQPPGKGYRHAVTPDQVRRRLAQLPRRMLRPLQVIQLSRMTRKKKTFPCYGMQWGSALYLYPVETDLVESYNRPPGPARLNEARMHGGRWVQASASAWKLIWTEAAIQDYYLNNILIHELGHLLDDRNTSGADRERYAEWFAIEHGYRAARRAELVRRAARKVVRRRHHCGG